MLNERHQCQMFAGRTLPGVSGSRKGGKKARKGQRPPLPRMREERENEEREMGKDIYSDARPLVICMADGLHRFGIGSAHDPLRASGGGMVT